MTEPKTDGFVKGDEAQKPNKGFSKRMKIKKETKKKEEITYRAKEWTNENEGCRNWTDKISDKYDGRAVTMCFCEN